MAGRTSKHAEPEGAARYIKEQLVNAKRYRGKKDLINALLEPGKAYTMAEVDEMLEKFMKGKVSAC
ncbi:hypothetical protein [Lacrimispora sp.]|uniref:hypothetical protein n=1 Tax=Lacrimispora sp. TaxID=2719234 RepID=UPI00346064B3